MADSPPFVKAHCRRTRPVDPRPGDMYLGYVSPLGSRPASPPPGAFAVAGGGRAPCPRAPD